MTMWTLHTDATAGAALAVAADLELNQPGVNDGCTISGMGSEVAPPKDLRELADELDRRGYITDLHLGSQ